MVCSAGTGKSRELTITLLSITGVGAWMCGDTVFLLVGMLEQFRHRVRRLSPTRVEVELSDFDEAEPGVPAQFSFDW